MTLWDKAEGQTATIKAIDGEAFAVRLGSMGMGEGATVRVVFKSSYGLVAERAGTLAALSKGAAARIAV